jgi:hypothetical protein
MMIDQELTTTTKVGEESRWELILDSVLGLARTSVQVIPHETHILFAKLSETTFGDSSNIKLHYVEARVKLSPDCRKTADTRLAKS